MAAQSYMQRRNPFRSRDSLNDAVTEEDEIKGKVSISLAEKLSKGGKLVDIREFGITTAMWAQTEDATQKILRAIEQCPEYGGISFDPGANVSIPNGGALLVEDLLITKNNIALFGSIGPSAFRRAGFRGRYASSYAVKTIGRGQGWSNLAIFGNAIYPDNAENATVDGHIAEYGVPYNATYVSANVCTIAANRTEVMMTGRRFYAKWTSGSTVFTRSGTVVSSVYTTLTTITISWDSDGLLPNPTGLLVFAAHDADVDNDYHNVSFQDARYGLVKFGRNIKDFDCEYRDCIQAIRIEPPNPLYNLGNSGQTITCRDNRTVDARFHTIANKVGHAQAADANCIWIEPGNYKTAFDAYVDAWNAANPGETARKHLGTYNLGHQIIGCFVNYCRRFLTGPASRLHIANNMMNYVKGGDSGATYAGVINLRAGDAGGADTVGTLVENNMANGWETDGQGWFMVVSGDNVRSIGNHASGMPRGGIWVTSAASGFSTDLDCFSDCSGGDDGASNNGLYPAIRIDGAAAVGNLRVSSDFARKTKHAIEVTSTGILTLTGPIHAPTLRNRDVFVAPGGVVYGELRNTGFSDQQLFHRRSAMAAYPSTAGRRYLVGDIIDIIPGAGIAGQRVKCSVAGMIGTVTAGTCTANGTTALTNVTNITSLKIGDFVTIGADANAHEISTINESGSSLVLATATTESGSTKAVAYFPAVFEPALAGGRKDPGASTTAIWFDVADPNGTVRNSSEQVASVYDKSGSAHHGTQATDAQKPVWTPGILRGKPALRFLNSANQYVNGSLTLSAPCSLYIVASIEAAGASSGRVAAFAANGATDLVSGALLIGRNGGLEQVRTYLNETSFGAKTITYGQLFLYTVIIGASSIRTRLNGGQDTTEAVTPVLATTRFAVGTNLGSSTPGTVGMTGYFGGMVIFSAAHGDAAMYDNEGLLLHRMIAAGLIPTAHPYFLSAP